jgi:hypothetical protein
VARKKGISKRGGSIRGVQVERQPGPLAATGALLISLIVVAPLAFLSPELALLGLGVTALAFFVLTDHRLGTGRQ